MNQIISNNNKLNDLDDSKYRIRKFNNGFFLHYAQTEVNDIYFYGTVRYLFLILWIIYILTKKL